MSGRVERSWPNLTNVGPSSSSISRRCRPRHGGVLGGRGAPPFGVNPNPWRTATCAISPRRPMLAVFEPRAIAQCCTLGGDRSARKRARNAAVDREHGAGGRPPAVGDQERDGLRDILPGHAAAEEAPRGVEGFDVVDGDAVRLGALAAGSSTRASSR